MAEDLRLPPPLEMSPFCLSLTVTFPVPCSSGFSFSLLFFIDYFPCLSLSRCLVFVVLHSSSSSLSLFLSLWSHCPCPSLVGYLALSVPLCPYSSLSVLLSPWPSLSQLSLPQSLRIPVPLFPGPSLSLSIAPSASPPLRIPHHLGLSLSLALSGSGPLLPDSLFLSLTRKLSLSLSLFQSLARRVANH